MKSIEAIPVRLKPLIPDYIKVSHFMKTRKNSQINFDTRSKRSKSTVSTHSKVSQVISSISKESLETRAPLHQCKSFFPSSDVESTGGLSSRQFTVNKLVGFSDNFLPIAPMLSKIGFDYQKHKPRTHSITPFESVPFSNFTSSQRVDMYVPTKGPTQLAPSQSSKKWAWAGSNGRLDGKAINGWHRYVEQSRK